ncbi:MAG: NADH-quinone oxidoreductase subunit N [Sulfuricurvum sp.]|jgi:NADH-quinone oxidoreductase subunit N|uniref:NADH-quinone oxidoreductase subunit N n=1 Tax=Sulfuricurvum sp. TaxID=2025608 RepID=UPI0025DBEC61|nr:NADH-quinone oxidoreductase subunit N [Sulfuricurvum sp.]MCK9371805.1 NADH-quinone oxidoreductase subunit N [Sulfuricurvum sp.]
MNPLFSVMPLLIVIASAVATMLLSSSKRLTSAHFSPLIIAVLSVTLIFQLPMIGTVYSTLIYPDIFNRMIIADSFSSLFTLLFTLGTLFTLAISNRYLIANPIFKGEFFALILFALGGMISLSMSYELISAFIALETTSLSIYVLIGLNRTDPQSSEAFFKYLLIGSFAGTFFLIGTFLIYLQTGTTHLHEIGAFILTHPAEEIPLVVIGGALIMATILFKIGAFMFHSWVMDVYDGATMPVMMFMASTFKIAIFSIAIRIYLVDLYPIVHLYEFPLQVTAILTLLGGSFLTLAQTSVKRMLAASSIVHSGYILLALASFQGSYLLAGPSIIFYLIAYFLSLVGALGILSYISYVGHEHYTFEDFKGFSDIHPLLAACMTIFMLSLAGFPSTIGFLGKFYLFSSALSSGHLAMTTAALFAAFVSIYYYFRLIAMIYFYGTDRPKLKIEFTLTTATISLIAALTIWGGIGTSLLGFIPGADGIIVYANQAIESLTISTR